MIRLLSFLFILFLPIAAYAEEETKTPEIPAGDFSALKHTKSGRIDKIVDGLTIILKDKTIIRLASLDIPDFHIWRDAPYSETALKLLEEALPEGTEIMIYQTRMAKKGRLNRMKHELAHIVTKKDPIWIQGMLLANGLARVQIAPNAPEMVDQMLQAEQIARQDKRGIWETESDYVILSPDTADKAMGEFALVEGTVKKTASVRNNVYLNFGDNWKKDFTIMIPPKMRKELARRGINPLGLAHQSLRIRGWVRDYNGPLIELETPEHLEYPLENAGQKTPLHEAEEGSTVEANS